jgi:hypothetical protein
VDFSPDGKRMCGRSRALPSGERATSSSATGNTQAIVMDREEAKDILASRVRELKRLSYPEFRSWIAEKITKTPVVKGPSGTEYQLEMQALWDSKPGADIRVIVTIDDGHLASSLFPLCDSFIVSPDGSVGGQ